MMWLFRARTVQRNQAQEAPASQEGSLELASQSTISVEHEQPSEQAVTQNTDQAPREGFFGWFWTHIGRRRGQRDKAPTDPAGELQVMLPNQPSELSNSGEVCLISESPYRILRELDRLDAQGSDGWTS
ncbi:unnamed protein product, partial [Iphiclides podalirius]